MQHQTELRQTRWNGPRDVGLKFALLSGINSSNPAVQLGFNERNKDMENYC